VSTAEQRSGSGVGALSRAEFESGWVAWSVSTGRTSLCVWIIINVCGPWANWNKLTTTVGTWERNNVALPGTTGTRAADHAAHFADISSIRSSWLLVSVCCALYAGGGCTSDEQPETVPATQPAVVVLATQPAEPPPSPPASQPSPLLPEFEAWSREEALARLTDEAASLSAAVRLVGLAEADPLCVPDPLSAEVARRLRVVVLSETLWALGLGTSDQGQLRSPVLIDAAGAVMLPVDGVEEEVALLWVAEDAELFPHVLTALERVWIVGEELHPALVAMSPMGLKFEVREEDDVPYVALLWRHRPEVADEGDQTTGGEPAEVARYTYDPYEFAFMGPLADKLPDPPGGLFELDLEQSEGLIPVGGEIPEPPPIEIPKFEPREGEPPPY
jgi:hypothetical protein